MHFVFKFKVYVGAAHKQKCLVHCCRPHGFGCRHPACMPYCLGFQYADPIMIINAQQFLLGVLVRTSFKDVGYEGLAP